VIFLIAGAKMPVSRARKKLTKVKQGKYLMKPAQNKSNTMRPTVKKPVFGLRRNGCAVVWGFEKDA
jgi:hypothetical protein